MLPNWHILPVSFNTNQRFTVEYSDTLLDAKGRSYYSLPRNYAIPLGFNYRELRNPSGIRLHPQQNRGKRAQQGVPFCRFVRAVCAIKFRHQLRQCSAAWVPQDGLDWGIHYCFGFCHFQDVLATATAQLKYSMTYL